MFKMLLSKYNDYVQYLLFKMIQFEHICAAKAHYYNCIGFKLMKDKSSENYKESFKLISMHLSKVQLLSFAF